MPNPPGTPAVQSGRAQPAGPDVIAGAPAFAPTAGAGLGDTLVPVRARRGDDRERTRRASGTAPRSSAVPAGGRVGTAFGATIPEDTTLIVIAQADPRLAASLPWAARPIVPSRS